MSNSLFAIVATPRPSVALAISAAAVKGVAIASVESKVRVIGHATVSLPSGAVEPTATTVNIAASAIVASAVRQVVKEVLVK